MVWRVDFEGKDESCAWVDDSQFIVLFPIGTNGSWCVRIGIKKNTSKNQQRCFKNRSRAMICVKNLLNSKTPF